ncbi:MAG: O-antigen ligase family protein [Candidatus Hadarchaeaceae archaeon]
MNALFFVILAVLGIGIAVFIFANWRRGIVLLFVWLYIENLVRAALPGKPPQVLLVKEMIIGLTYLSFFGFIIFSGKKSVFPRWARILILALPTGVIGLLSAISQGVEPIFMGLGLRGYYWYIPLALLGYKYFRTEKHLEKFCRAIVYLSVPLLMVATLQYIFWDVDSPFIRPISGGFHSAYLGVVPLIPGIFGSHARFARIEFFTFIVGLVLALSIPKRENLLSLSVLAAVVGLMMTGYRTIMVLSAVCGLVFLLISERQRIGRIMKALSPIVAGVLLLLAWREDLRYFLMIDAKSELLTRPAYTTAAAFGGIEKYGIVGFGLGTMSQGIDYVVDPEEKPQVREGLLGWFESGIARVGFETGVLGLVAWFTFLLAFLVRCGRELFEQETTFRRRFSLGIFIFLMAITTEFILVRHQTFQDGTTMVIYWFFAGVLLALKRLDMPGR